MPTIMIDPDTIAHGPRVIEPRFTRDILIGYVAKLLGDTSSGGGMGVPVSMVTESVLVEVTDAQLEVLEAFFEQVHTARRSKECADDSDDTADGNCVGSGPDVSV